MSNHSLWQTGRGQFAKLTLTNTSSASADIYRYGAHLTSWKTANGKEWMFLSEQAQFAAGKAIRGGVPVIFPQFSGFGAGQRHGFARNIEWQLANEPSEQNGESRCKLILKSSDSTLALWPHRFRAEFIPSLTAQQLTMTLAIQNTDSAPFTFTTALHTYFAVSDIHKVALQGLSGVSYWDNNGSDFARDRFVQNDDQLAFPDAIDRVYFSCQKPLQLIDGNERLSIQADGFTEVVVWNPGVEATKKLDDMANEEYQNMLCVEAALIDKPVTLAPGEVWQGSQILKAP
jgi:glucose-6-phosphate 1-epimerase